MRVRDVAAVLTALALLAPPVAASADCAFSKFADLPVTMTGLRPLVPAKINGKDARFIVDSGAFYSTLGSDVPSRYNMRVGPAPIGLGSVRGIGGEAREVRSTTADDFIFANIDFGKVDFLVNERGFGAGSVGLLGENILHAADVEYDLGKGVIRLFSAKGCQSANLAYWAGSAPYSVITAEAADPNKRGANTVYIARLNGYRIRVVFDTGAERSLLTIHAAARAGVKPGDPGVVSTGAMSGVALRSYVHTWLAPFSDLQIGDEDVKNFKLLIADTGTDEDADLLIGEDFFLSHHILVSNSQNKLYFTYSGGPVFNMKLPGQAAAAVPAAAEPSAASAPAGAEPPLDADGYSRRAAAESARRDFTAAVADLTQAIALSPNDARYYYQRGLADERLLGNPAKPPPYPPMKDFDAALNLKPSDVAVLLSRSGLYVLRRQPVLAKADLDAADKAAAADPAQRLKIAMAYAREDYDQPAIGELDQWIAANPKDDDLATALNLRCRLRGMLNQDLAKAADDCEASLKLAPGRPSGLESRGLLRLRQGDFDKAIADYSASLKIEPGSAWALYGRGLAKLKKGLTADGQADLKAATALQPRIADDAAKRGLTP